MTVVSHVYTKNMLSLGSKLENISSDALKVMLLSAYTVGSTQDTAQFVSDVLAAGTETSGTGYTAGGQALTSVTFTETAASHLYTLTAANPSWANSTFSAAYAVYYDSTPGSNATNPVLAYVDFGGTFSSSNGTFQITINASGILTYTGS